ncbi:MAG: hypothetical protein WC107_07370 [Patescibacteria group bacterium]
MYTKEMFLEQVKDHTLTVIKEDGLYRHVRVGRPDTICESWEIHTWPGYLAMAGDMGCWVFQRTLDMFCFFRPHGAELETNPRYWAEKLEATDKTSDGWEKFSISKFQENVKQCAIDACGVETFEEIPEERRDDLSTLLNASDEWDAVAAVREFESEWLCLADFWECSCQEMNTRFAFACYAIPWTVMLYDKVKQIEPSKE